MKNILFQSILWMALAIASFSCKKDDKFSELVRDNRPAVPVTFPGATTFGFNPYVETSLEAGGAIKFTLSIPASSGRTIREITKVGAGGSEINAATLNSAGYFSTPITGNGTTAEFTTTTAEFTTTIAEFNTKRKATITTPLVPPSFREIAFIFLLTLDDGTEIITTQVRVRVLK